MIVDALGTEFKFNGFVVGRITRYDLQDGVVPDIAHRPISGPKRFLPGKPEHGTISLILYRDLEDPGQQEIANAIRSRSVVNCQWKLADGRILVFDAYGKRLPITGLIDNVNTSSALIKIAGPVEPMN